MYNKSYFIQELRNVFDSIIWEKLLNSTDISGYPDAEKFYINWKFVDFILMVMEKILYQSFSVPEFVFKTPLA